MPPLAVVDAARQATLAYLSAHYGRGRDLSWHPLFTALRELWIVSYGSSPANAKLSDKRKD